MSIQASIYHLTHYKYDRPVTLSPQIIRLRPAPHSRTPVLSHSLKVSPEGHFVNHQQDPYGNWLARFVFSEPVREFKIEVDLIADMSVYNPFDFFVAEDAETWPFKYPKDIKPDLKIYTKTTKASHFLKALIAEFLAGNSRKDMRTIDFIVALNAFISQKIDYVIRYEPGVQTPDETLELAKGSCRDSSWLLVNVLRHLGLAARFVSGYLIQLKPDLKSLDGPSGTEQDFTDLHAWTEVYLPGAGWVGLDPTSGLLTGESHIPLAATPHYTNAAPIVGMASDAEVDFVYDMKVNRVAEHPRITKPFSDDAWDELDQLGKRVDDILNTEDVRLTMGGEPTFVSIDDFESPEWNTDAVGPTKKDLADKLIRRLRDKFAPGGFLHYGQGKWYPGETLPRWTYSLYWRKDQKPIWTDGDLIAPETGDTKATSEQSKLLLDCIAEKLELDAEMVQPAFEDPAEWILRESALPENVTPENSKLKDAEERARIARVFERGLTEAAGHILPIQSWNSLSYGRKWRSEKWSTRRGKIFLTPGDSPVGFRLPLSGLPHLPKMQYPHVFPSDPTSDLPDLPEHAAYFEAQNADENSRVQPSHRNREDYVQQQEVAQDASIIQAQHVRTALAVEPRDGHLRVFMPPTENTEDYLDLIHVTELAAQELDLQVHIEGYAPESDPRLNVIKVAPDPGVLEVNIHPAASWEECVEITNTVYEEARQTRLGTDKFMIDGKHTGTGGGNHVVVGGATPLDSPFLRRPDLLKSLILHWQRHPSLSYLFSGLFIGPTSQAPRIDEARHDSLYELEIALAQIPKPGEGVAPMPWLTDRLLRNILIDVTGNTHRTEICIDKLYSPDGPTGRLGLVEFRGFEMPPNPRMSLAQQLLIRALIARFWQTPISGNPKRWGTHLHDKFMLPEFIWSDFLEVLEDLKLHGFDLKPDWFKAHAEFRFPFCGVLEHEEMTLEIRQALEPWHVMGETGAIGGTVRYTDSSVERLQVKLSGADLSRYAVTCNGREVPLSTSPDGESVVAGVRYKAWQAPLSMHPVSPVDAPLTFDIYDKWSKRAVGGCVYHVAHPAGRNYETFPVNGNEAEARRLSRFQAFGHSPGSYPVLGEKPHSDFPMTLDLRRPAGI